MKYHFTQTHQDFDSMVGDIKTAMFKLATEESAHYVMEHMLEARPYEGHAPMLIDMVKRAKEGLVLEFGVADGESINLMADVLPQRTIYGFDSFAGMPEDFAMISIKKGDIAQSQLPDVRRNVQLVQGFFEDTLGDFLNEHNEDIAFVHLDCTLYSAASCVYEKIWSHLKKGSLILSNLYYNYPGWNKGAEYKAFHEMIDKHEIKYRYVAYSTHAYQVAMEIL